MHAMNGFDETIPIFDLHADIGYDLWQAEDPDARWQFHERRWKEGGLRGINVACWFGHNENWAQMQAMVKKTRSVIERQGHRLICCRDDIEPEANWTLLSVEGMGGIRDDAEACVDWLYDQGVRIASLCWNEANLLADGVGANTDEGIHPLGYRVLEQMKRRGMILDLSHLNRAGTAAALALDLPCIVTHSNAYAICAHKRNLTDEQLRLLAKRDTVVGLNATPFFIHSDPPRQTAMMLAKHASYMKTIIGVNRLALGFDFMDYFTDEFVAMPQDMPSITKGQVMIRALEAEGFTKKEIEQISYQNVLSFLARQL